MTEPKEQAFTKEGPGKATRMLAKRKATSLPTARTP